MHCLPNRAWLGAEVMNVLVGIEMQLVQLQKEAACNQK